MQKILWERIHHLEQDISALMKIDEIVTSSVMKTAGDQPSGNDKMPFSSLNSEETPSEYSSKSIKTLYPPPPQQSSFPSPSSQSHAFGRSTKVERDLCTKQVPCGGLQKEKSASIAYARRGNVSDVSRKENKFVKNIGRGKNVRGERHNRQHSPFTTFNADIKSTGMMKPERVAGERDLGLGPKDNQFVTDAKCPLRQRTAAAHREQFSGNCDVLLQRLADETRLRAEAEQQLRSLQQGLEQSRSALGDAQRARAAALDVAQQLRDKYETLRNARRLAQNNVQLMKTENSNLAKRLRMLEAERTVSAGEGAEAERRRMEDLEAQAAQQRRRADSLQRQLEDERRKREEEHMAVEAATRPLRERLQESTRQLQEAEDRARALQERLQKVQIESESAVPLQQRQPLSAHDPEVRQLLAAETLRIAEELNKQAQDARELRSRCDDLQRQMREREAEERRRLHALDERGRGVREALQRKEELLQRERDELQGLVRDLSEALRVHKAQVQDLGQGAQRSDGLLRAQAEALASKEERLRLAESEAATLRQRTSALQAEAARAEESLRALRRANEDLVRSAEASRICALCTAAQERLAAAQEELRQCKEKAETARDSLRIKEKMLEDQAQSLRRLKQQRLDEKEAAARDHQALQAEIVAERRDSQRLRQELKGMYRRCQQQAERAEGLERALAEAEAEAAGEGARAELEQQRRTLDRLERQVLEQRAAWEEEAARLRRDKEQALHAAEFSAKRLEETLVEFQRQTATQREAQLLLAAQLAERDRELEEARRTVNVLKRSLDNAEGCAKLLCLREDGRLGRAGAQNTRVLQELTLCA